VNDESLPSNIRSFVIQNSDSDASWQLIMAQTQSSLPGNLQCSIVTPEATVLETDADFVALPLYDGEAGVLPGRAPLIGRLGYGELRVHLGKAEKRYYVDGGFVQVAENRISVLTNRAVSADALDAGAAGEQLRTAISRRAAGREEMAIRDRLILQARGQLRVAARSR
jgi:F-type H+-transporting ATPase subunit epsilon